MKESKIITCKSTSFRDSLKQAQENITGKNRSTDLKFASPCIIIHFKYINQLDAKFYQVYYFAFMYSSTCFRRPQAHHQELDNYSSRLWFYRWGVVVAALLSPRSKTTGFYCSC
jgi:hypothetical protein